MLAVTKATAADIPLIRQLTFDIWPQTYRDLLSQEQIDYMLELMYSPVALQKQMQQDNCTFILLYDDELPIAFASYNEQIPGTWKLHKIYILPSQQGKGIGRFIINYILDEIRPLQAKTLQLQVKRDNKAKDFYEKIGFKIIQTADFDIGNGYFMKDYVMELTL